MTREQAIDAAKHLAAGLLSSSGMAGVLNGRSKEEAADIAAQLYVAVFEKLLHSELRRDA